MQVISPLMPWRQEPLLVCVCGVVERAVYVYVCEYVTKALFISLGPSDAYMRE